MMQYFCEVTTALQVFQLVLSVLTVVFLTVGCVLSLRHKYNLRKRLTQGVVLLINIALYVLMQLDSRITGADHRLHLPYVLLVLFTVYSLCFAVWSILRETKNRQTINNTSIKEAFDNLPTGVCFFNEAGLPVLCNRAMHRFTFAVCGKDVQFITDLQDCLSESFVPQEGVVRAGKIFTLPGGDIWQLEKRSISHANDILYTQFTTLDVTQLQQKRIELTQENAQLRKAQAELKQLSANVVTITREEEILNTKMRVHDEMGKCLLVAQQYLKEDPAKPLPAGMVSSWQRAVSMLKYSNETQDEDMLLQIRKTCEFVQLEYVQTGALPAQEKVAYLLTCAVRECVTNAVRYAEATELYVDFSETEAAASVVITNNGKSPEGEIKEGGGLSTLRRRIEREGGTMQLQAQPVFRLKVTVPKGKESIL